MYHSLEKCIKVISEEITEWFLLQENSEGSHLSDPSVYFAVKFYMIFF